ncbi:hypothetical protein J2S53_003506 [Actinopolyspora lacussalsi]|nr:hypothetical protein [Actinopolyspora lacussalsi]
MVIDVGRDRVLAYRAAAQELARTGTEPESLRVFRLGVQDNQSGAAVLALAARCSGTFTSDDVFDGGRTVRTWSVRGAPHLHGRAELPGLATALWPLDDGDAETRLGSSGRAVRKAGVSGTEAFRLVAAAMRDTVTEPMTKGDASAGVSRRVPDALKYDCRTCGATHVYGSLFQNAALAAGILLDPRASGTVLLPDSEAGSIPGEARGTDELIRAYLRLHGPATPETVADFFGTRADRIRRVWPEGLTEVRVAGSAAWLDDSGTEELRSAPPFEEVRLLPPTDPFLQARDRSLLLPDESRRKELWKSLNSPGAVFARGEILGTWRLRGAGRKRSELRTSWFEGAPDSELRSAVEREAERVREVNGVEEVRVVFEE